MTKAASTRPDVSRSVMPAIAYRVAMPHPETHLFEVTVRVQRWSQAVLDLKMPVWTPGSYLVREYSRHVQNFEARGADGQKLTWQKRSKNHWQIETPGASEIVVTYQVFANELTVRTNHLDLTHGYFNGAALFFWVAGCDRQPLQVEIVPPTGWQVATPLPEVAGQPDTYEAADFDTLVDSPFEIGQQTRYRFEVRETPHELVVWGTGNLDAMRLIPDIQKIIETEAQLFGGLPYDRYVFLLHLSAQGYGGLEHKNACTLNFPRLGFRAEESYQRFLQLVAHEFFHLWNVKRLRPKALERFDYEQENYTPSLWFSEGTTIYYDLLLPLRAGIYDAKVFLKALSKELTRFLMTPGRLVQPLSESSFDAWIKLYRQDASSNNSQISYYLKGERVSLLLDLLIRDRHQNRRSLDDVMRQLWEEFGTVEVGFTPEQLEGAIAAVADADLRDFFQRFLHTTEELPLNDYLAPFGLRVVPETDGEPVPYLGMTVKTEAGREVVKSVEAGSPAQQAGFDPGDELLAIDGLRVTAEQLGDRLKDYRAGSTIQVTSFRQDQLRECALTLAAPRPGRYQIVPVENPTPAQEANFTGWLGTSLSSIL